MSVLSGLGNLGLGNLEGADVFGAEKKEEEQKKQAAAQSKAPTIEDFVFDKKYSCPVCYQEFVNPTMKANKVKMTGQDSDLRPKYEPIDPIKYDIIACPRCGYAALTRYFDKITPPQAKLIKSEISASFHGLKHLLDYSYDDAIERYQLALANAIVKRAKASEKAYLCLKLAWVLRAKMEALDIDLPDYDDQMAELKKDEMELLQNALDGFINARQTEDFPMCGMDESTVDYIISVTATKFEKYDIASKLIAGILTDAKANPRIKDKARDLKDDILQQKNR
ncbi:MAG: DUF2225 domain-containing protein [Lachnospiraceae bacterium]|nr:DUF2225 domain-containing protein [Lachnospiraceae bacterium]